MNEANAPQTIKDLANEARCRAKTAYGRPAFARLCLDFDWRVCESVRQREGADSHETSQLEEVLRLMAAARQDESQYVLDAELAACWLDAKGYGAMSVAALQTALSRVKQPKRSR